MKWIGNFAPRIDIEIGSALRNNSDLSRTRSSREGNYNKKNRYVSPNDIISSLHFQSPQLTCFLNVRSLTSLTEKLSNNYHGHESVAHSNFRSFYSGQERTDACERTIIITVQWIQRARWSQELSDSYRVRLVCSAPLWQTRRSYKCEQLLCGNYFGFARLLWMGRKCWHTLWNEIKSERTVKWNSGSLWRAWSCEISRMVSLKSLHIWVSVLLTYFTNLFLTIYPKNVSNTFLHSWCDRCLSECLYAVNFSFKIMIRIETWRPNERKRRRRSGKQSIKPLSALEDNFYSVTKHGHPATLIGWMALNRGAGLFDRTENPELGVYVMPHQCWVFRFPKRARRIPLLRNICRRSFILFSR